MFRNSRWIGCVCIGIALVTSSVQAQTRHPSPKEIGQIIDVALDAALPLADSLSGGILAERKIRFDYGRTMAAFRHADNAGARASLGLTRIMTEGSAELLEDCGQLGMQQCSKLGQSVYVYVQPISLSDSEAAVRVHAVWATTMPSKRTFQSSSSREVFLRRSGSGPWTFVRVGEGIIS